jgi:hypothetical protein
MYISATLVLAAWSRLNPHTWCIVGASVPKQLNKAHFCMRFLAENRFEKHSKAHPKPAAPGEAEECDLKVWFSLCMLGFGGNDHILSKS